jgi:hypothetical protein
MRVRKKPIASVSVLLVVVGAAVAVGLGRVRPGGTFTVTLRSDVAPGQVATRGPAVCMRAAVAPSQRRTQL